MSFSILILLILIVIIGLCSFFLISLNESIISLDLLIIEIDLSSEERKNFEKSVEAVKDLFEAAKKIDKELQN